MTEERDEKFDGLVAGYLNDRDRRFTKALDDEGFAHNGPRSVELYVDDAIYCIPDDNLSVADVERMFKAFEREDVDYDIMLLAERWTEDGYVQQWPEDVAYGPRNLQDCRTSGWPQDARYRLHLWLDMTYWVAEADVREKIDAGEDLYWVKEGGQA